MMPDLLISVFIVTVSNTVLENEVDIMLVSAILILNL
jgi:hypothetical protein